MKNKKMKQNYLLLFILFVFFVGFVQLAYATDGDEVISGWNKTYDSGGVANQDSVAGVAIDSNGNVYVVGSGYNLVSEVSSYDWLIKKYDSAGVEDTNNWNKNFSGAISGGYDYPKGVAIDSNNNVYVVGWGTNLTSGPSGQDWWVKKFNSSGVEDTVNWNKTVDYNNGNGIAYSVVVDSNDNVYVVGTGYNLVTGTSNLDWWVKKYNSSGVEDTSNWNKTFNSPLGTATDSPSSVTVDSNDNVYVVGVGQGKWWMKKFSSSGVEDTINWNLLFDSGSQEAANGVAVDSSDNVYIVGTGNNLVSENSNSDWLIKKFSSSGIEDETWNKTFNSEGTYDGANGVAIDSNNNVYVVGYGYNIISGESNNDWVIKRFSSIGVEDTTYWNQSFNSASGGYDFPFSVAIDSSDVVYVGGYGDSIVSGISSFDWWVKKFEGYTASPEPGAVPEFSDYGLLLVMVIGLTGFFVVRRKE